MADINIVVAAQVGGAIGPLQQVQRQTRAVGAQVIAASGKVKQFGGIMGSATRDVRKFALGGLQQAGYQIGDYAVQVANGTSKMQAFGQQAPQLLQIFGPFGAIIGAGVAIFAAFGVAMSKSGQEMSNFGGMLGTLQTPLSNVVSSIWAIKDAFSGMSTLFLQNIDTLLIAVGLFASYVGIRMVAAAIRASASTGMLSSAMVTFRAAVLASAIASGGFTGALTIMRAAVLVLGGALAAVGRILLTFLPIAILFGVAKLVEMFLNLKNAVGGVGMALGALRDVFSMFVDAIGSRIDVFVLYFKRMGPMLQAFFGGIINLISATITAGINQIIDGVNTIYEKVGLTQLQPLVGGDIIDLTAIQTKLADLDSQISDASDKAAGGWDAFKTKLSEIFGLMQDPAPVNIFSEGLANAADKGKSSLTEMQERVKSIATSITTSMSNAFMSMVDGTSSAKDAFKSMARDIIKQLYQVLVVQRMVNSLLGVMGFSKGVSGDFTEWSNPFAGKRAMGGPVTGGKPYLVGENGPEIVVPSRTATVLPNGQGGGGVTVVQNISVTTGVQQTVRAEIMGLMPQIAAASKAAVLDAKRRGGAFAGAF